jgi:CRISPR-associated protein Cas2
MDSDYKKVRILIMYDLPMTENIDVKEYNKFRKNLLTLGCYRIQYSIYAKILGKEVNYNSFITKLKKVLPSSGEIRVIKITEKQYENMIFLSGSRNNHEKKVSKESVVIF